jgi:hypothetical protein
MNAFIANKHAGPCVNHLILVGFVEYSDRHCVPEETTYVCLR